MLEKPKVAQLEKKFASFHGTNRFCVYQSTPISLRSILILSSHLGPELSNGLFPSDFLT
jgi:hypothetical protein